MTTVEARRPPADGVFERLDRFVAVWSPFTPLHGLVRTALALSLALTLVLTPLQSLFFRTDAHPDGAVCGMGSLTGAGLFCLAADGGWIGPARWLAVLVLVVVATGVAPRLTGIPHWYITWSFATSSNVVDGGDQLSANLTLLLAAMSLMDRRRSHWHRDTGYATRPALHQYLPYGLLALWIGQMVGVYFQASVAKMAVPEWEDGSALWYWMQNPAFAPAAPLQDAFLVALQFPVLSMLLTYGTLVLQLSLCVAPFFGFRVRRIALLVAAVFHIGIAMVMGLWSFSIVMIAADLLLLVRSHEVHLRLRPGDLVRGGRLSDAGPGRS